MLLMRAVENVLLDKLPLAEQMLDYVKLDQKIVLMETGELALEQFIPKKKFVTHWIIIVMNLYI